VEKHREPFVEKITSGVGSPTSVILHTIIFAAAFAVGFFSIAPWDMVLLVLTTAVSLEAIYLAIFIQMTVNQHTKSLQEVEEDIDEIQEDVDEIQEDVDEIQEDVEEDNKLEEREAATLESLARDMRNLLTEIEELKKK
jgi:peptidoglycan hydrolase CwlO-like protein